MSFGKWLAAAVICAFLGKVARAEEFIRVEEDPNAVRLQTAVTHFEKDGAKVDLIGAIHIADKAYYNDLTTRFTTYDSLLFEMVGGEKFPAAKAEENPVPAAEPVPADPIVKKKQPNLSGLHKIYETIASYLDLTGQVDQIDYTTKNFVHADLTSDEFFDLQAARKESLFTFMLKASFAAQKSTLPQPDSFKLLQGIIAHNGNLLKLQLVHTLGDGDNQMASLMGDSVIITDRNKRCLEVMQRELDAGHKVLGIFYGAAHFPDMSQRLLEQGFVLKGQDWLTAWDIPKPAEKPVVAPAVAAPEEPAAVTP